jgi:hypothetical protein
LAFCEIGQVEARQDDQRHQQIDADNDAEGERRPENRRSGLAAISTMDFRRIKFSRGGRALAHEFIIGSLLAHTVGIRPIALACPPRRAFRPPKPPKPES